LQLLIHSLSTDIEVLLPCLEELIPLFRQLILLNIVCIWQHVRSSVNRRHNGRFHHLISKHRARVAQRYLRRLSWQANLREPVLILRDEANRVIVSLVPDRRKIVILYELVEWLNTGGVIAFQSATVFNLYVSWRIGWSWTFPALAPVTGVFICLCSRSFKWQVQVFHYNLWVLVVRSCQRGDECYTVSGRVAVSYDWKTIQIEWSALVSAPEHALFFATSTTSGYNLK